MPHGAKRARASTVVPSEVNTNNKPRGAKHFGLDDRTTHHDTHTSPQSFVVSRHTPRSTHLEGGSSVRSDTGKMKLRPVRFGFL